MTFQDLLNFNKLQKTKPYKVAFGIPGMIGGFNYSVLDGLESIRQELELPEIVLYIFTWKDEPNLIWVNKLEKLRKEYPYVKIYIELEDINASGYIEGIGGILDNLNIRYAGKAEIDKYNNKRILSLYAQYRLFKLIRGHEYNYPYLEEDNKTLIFKINTNLLFRQGAGKPFKHAIEQTLHTLLKHICTVNSRDILHPYDILYTSSATSTGISDKMYASSISTLNNIFGKDDGEFWKKIFEVYRFYQNKYPLEMKNIKDLEVFGKDLNYFPLEGSIFLKHLAGNIEYYSNPDLLKWTDCYRHIVNPWPEIVHGQWVYKETETWDFLKNINTKFYKQYIINPNETDAV